MLTPKTSYSQSGEDLIVRCIFDSLGLKKPTYCDIGAHHPYYLSNTAHFYESGCRGINIEPNPVLFKEFLIHRSKDINVNVGIADGSSHQTFYEIRPSTMSTFSREEAESRVSQHGFEIVAEHIVPVSTLGQILRTYAPGASPDFLSIDAEGMDQVILNSIDFAAWSPLVICCETLSFAQDHTGVKNHDCIEFVKSKGYMLYADTHINSIFVLQRAWRKPS